MSREHKRLDHISIVEETPSSLESYASVSIAYTVSSRYELSLVNSGLQGISIKEVPVRPSYEKDYDAYKGEGPTRWRKWNLSNWGFLAAYVDGRRIGAAVLASKTDGVNMLEGRSDLAALWDLRVSPDCRGSGVGTRLFCHAEQWAASRGCRTLKIETQNVNVPACKFYARNGCHLGAVHLHAYPDLPDEARMLWYKGLPASELLSDR